ncbi:MAG: TerB family tellurite resistance protein [Polyangiaceae bacterium]
MNPPVFSEKLDCKEELKEFIAVCGVAVAVADQNVDTSEIKAIKRLLGKGTLANNLPELIAAGPEALGKRAQELSSMLVTRLSPLRCHKVVEDICSIAVADGKTDEAEVDTLYGVAELLNVSLPFVDGVLSRVSKPLD